MKTLVRFLFAISLVFNSSSVLGQVSIAIDPLDQGGAVGNSFKHGIFYVPKTQEAIDLFENNGSEYNAIRLHIIESALNNTTNLNDALAYLDLAEQQLQDISNRSEKVIFIFEKMPAWLSSSSDGSPAQTPGWFVLNTKPPADYNAWNSVVSALTDQLVNGYGIDNAYFEIWNEPDLGSWTGTEAEYFELFTNTYDAIKSVNNTIPVGGPATNFWGNHINWEPPYGYLRNEIADSSLLAALLDSSSVWNKPLDFVSWHNFHMAHSIHLNILNYTSQKCSSLGIQIPETIISEWNTPSSFRDTDLQRSFFIKNQINISKTATDNNVVAAWQDFNSDPQEFHGDYGLLTYGGIEKPAHKALQLSERLQGSFVNYNINEQIPIVASAHTNTLQILVTNYAPDPLGETINHLLFDWHYNIEQLDSAGFIDIAGNSLSPLDSILDGTLSFTPVSSMDIIVANAAQNFTYYQSIANGPRTYEFNINNPSSINEIRLFRVDSLNNNAQFEYEALIAGGMTQAQAVSSLNGSDILSMENISPTSNFVVTLEPNAVLLVEVLFASSLGLIVSELQKKLLIYPNPTNEVLHVEQHVAANVCYRIETLYGQLLREQESQSINDTIPLDGLAPGVYLLRLKDQNVVQQFIVK
ncbi:MAG: T9SS type A sorting domain-containing protein [bacterium]|nr:T9SS type A sorting domain-containing protein [bacterium]